MDQGETETDGNRSKTSWSQRRGGAQNDDKEEGRQDNLDEQARHHAVAAR